jgi:ABC-type branched-subunit amino acid transport system substrate-binding protein
MEYSGVATRLGHPMMIEERYDNGETDFSLQLENIKRVRPDAVLIWGNAKESALILNQMRKMGMTQPVYASDRIISDEFLKLAGANAEGIVSTSPYNPEADKPSLRKFQEAYKRRFESEPDVFAAHAYDGMRLIIKAIEKAGLNRVLIRDVLTDLKTFQGYEGVTGEIILDESWNDIGDIFMAEVKGGRFVYRPSPPLGERQHTSSMPGY